MFVEGSIPTRSYEKDGEKKSITEIVAHDVKFLAGGQGPAGRAGSAAG